MKNKGSSITNKIHQRLVKNKLSTDKFESYKRLVKEVINGGANDLSMTIYSVSLDCNCVVNKTSVT